MIIDLSKYNVVTDWKKIKNSVSGVILRCGYRGYGSGKIIEDAKLKEFATACKQNNVPFGLYFMSQAINVAEGKEEAEYSLAKAKEYEAKLPVFIDSEDGDGTARTVRADALSKDERTEIVKKFCDTVISSGVLAGVYASESWYMEKLHYEQLKDKYIIWAAKYGTNTGIKTSKINLSIYHMHQYTSKGTVAGIKGNVDLNEGDIEKISIKDQQTVSNTAQSTHVQLNYQQGQQYTNVVESLRIRTKRADQAPAVLPNGEILGIMEKGAKIKNQATARVGGQIWMYIGLNARKQEQWICADTGAKSYIH